jgi:uncharacterized protein (TIGR02453 family)
MAFAGFDEQTIAWFRGLEADNSHTYFEATRERYQEHVRGPMEALLADLRDAEFGGTVKLFRQNRDVRFGGDRMPFKTRTYGILHKRTGSEAGLYAQVSSAGLWVGTGYFEMLSDQLARYQKAVLDEDAGPALVDLLESVKAAGLDVGGEELKTVPRGFDKKHPRAFLLRHKQHLIVGRDVKPGPEMFDAVGAKKFTASTWRVALPLVGWLDQHVGATTVSAAERWGRRRR